MIVSVLKLTVNAVSCCLMRNLIGFAIFKDLAFSLYPAVSFAKERIIQNNSCCGVLNIAKL